MENTNKIQGLTFGRIVHFVDDFRKEHPAIIIQVEDYVTGKVWLRTFSILRGRDRTVEATFNEKDKGIGTWHYPERE